MPERRGCAVRAGPGLSLERDLRVIGASHLSPSRYPVAIREKSLHSPKVWAHVSGLILHVVGSLDILDVARPAMPLSGLGHVQVGGPQKKRSHMTGSANKDSCCLEEVGGAVRAK